MLGVIVGALSVGSLFFAALPATTNYQLNSYGFGSGGTSNSGTSNYSLEGITGEISSQTTQSSNYTVKPGFIETQQANVPKVTLTNPSNYWDKLKFVIDQQSNPTDALYALQVCVGSDFTPAGSCSTYKYVKADHTLGTSLAITDYQDYATWGGASGTTMIGLSASTQYFIRAKATQGKFTESAYGPSSNATTSSQQISFCLYSNANCAAGGASEAFGGLTPTIVANSPTNVGIDFATNANGGGNVYVYSQYGAMHSTRTGGTLLSATADLDSAGGGYGAQINSTSQSSGATFTKVSPYNGSTSGNNVGVLSASVNTLLTAASPISGGTAAVQIKIKPYNTTPASPDYSDTLTFIAAASF